MTTTATTITHTVYHLLWDNGLDACGEFHWDFATHDDATLAGEDWLTDFRTSNVVEADDDQPSYTVLAIDRQYPAWKYGARWICDGPEGRFHARTKRDLVRMMANNCGAIEP